MRSEVTEDMVRARIRYGLVIAALLAGPTAPAAATTTALPGGPAPTEAPASAPTSATTASATTASATTASATTAAQGAEEVRPGVIDVVVIDDAAGAWGERRDGTGEPDTGRPLLDLAGLRTRTLVTVDGRTLDVPDALASGLRSGDRVEVRLERAGVHTLDVDRPAARVIGLRRLGVRSAATPPIPSPAGEHTLTVLPVYWTAPDSTTPAQLTTLAQATAQYWSRQSGGTIRTTATVKPWRQIADPGSCDPSLLFDRALAANGLAAPGSSRHHVLVYFTRRSDCGGWAGLGSVSGSRIWSNGYPLIDVFAHEFGHNLGLGHANTTTCTSAGGRVTWSAGCSTVEYHDSADVMGYATFADSGNLNSGLADQLGLLRSVTASAAAAVTADLAPLSQPNGVRAVKLALGTGSLYVDYRPAQAPDTREPEWAGVQVHYVSDEAIPQSQLLDLQPWTASPFTGVSLPEHDVWRVPGAGVAIGVAGTGATAKVRVVPTASDTSAPPTPTLALATTGIGEVSLNWSAVTDSGSGVAGYRVSADGVRIALAGPDQTSLTLTPPNGTSVLGITAVDAAGNVSGTATQPIRGVGGAPPDTTPPSAVVVTAPADGAVVGTTRISWTWRAATDVGTGVAGYRLYAYDALVASYDETVLGVGVDLPPGSVVLGVAAVDGSGLEGRRTEVTVTVDTAAPTAPSRLRRLPGTGVLAWTASSDDTAIRYRLTLDGAVLPRTSNPVAPVAARAGRHTWTVQAIDAAGNRSGTASLVDWVDTTAPPAPRPALVTPPGARRGYSPRQTVVVRWPAVTDADSSVPSYLVRVDGRAGAIRVPASGATVGVSLTLPTGRSTVRVAAVNAGGTPGASAATSVVVDTTAPARLRVSSAARRYRTSPLVLSWGAASDAQSGILAIKVLVDGRTVARLPAGATRATLTPVQLGRATRVSVVAVNGASLTGPAATLPITLRAQRSW